MRNLGLKKQPRQAFTLVELAVLIMIVGVLAAFGVPRFIQSVERSKASEAFSYLAAVRSAQERFHARQGTFAGSLTDLDITFPPPKYFNVGAIAAGDTGDLEDSWSLTLTRTGASAGYGPYTVVFNEQGYDATNSGIEALTDINPLSH